VTFYIPQIEKYQGRKDLKEVPVIIQTATLELNIQTDLLQQVAGLLQSLHSVGRRLFWKE